ncbi:MAG: pantoate--beta-alanine ligase [Nitrospirota bacterium]
MKLIDKISDMQHHSESLRKKGRIIGFVPTMGFLHEGHLSLIREAKKVSDVVIVSIFVNPTQFGPAEDYEQYPRDLTGDIEKVESTGGDIVFVPPVSEMYPTGYLTYVDVERITDTLCGSSRPGHFKGVATVVTKLFNIVKPHRAFFGQKDYQQTVVIRRMVRDLNMGVEIIVCPTVRELDGLAMSSRNSYLNPQERKAATVLYRSLKTAEEIIKAGERDTSVIYDKIQQIIIAEPLCSIDYINIVHPETLEDIKSITEKTVLALAVRIGSTRLIDNILVEP